MVRLHATGAQAQAPAKLVTATQSATLEAAL